MASRVPGRASRLRGLAIGNVPKAPPPLAFDAPATGAAPVERGPTPQLVAEACGDQQPAEATAATLQNKALTTLAGLEVLVPNLRSLDAAYNRVSKAGPGLGPGLLHLRLSDNALGGVLDDGLAGLTALQTLELSNNHLTSLGTGLDKLRALKALRVDANALETLEGLRHQSCLTSLDASFNPNIGRIAHLGALTSLEDLSVAACGLTQLANLDRFARLTELNVASNRLDGGCLPALRALLALDCLNIQDNRVASLTQLPPLPSLTELYLAGNALVTAVGGADLNALCPQLQVLDVARNPCSAAPPTGATLVGLAACASLVELTWAPAGGLRSRRTILRAVPQCSMLDGTPVTQADRTLAEIAEPHSGLSSSLADATALLATARAAAGEADAESGGDDDNSAAADDMRRFCERVGVKGPAAMATAVEVVVTGMTSPRPCDPPDNAPPRSRAMTLAEFDAASCGFRAEMTSVAAQMTAAMGGLRRGLKCIHPADAAIALRSKALAAGAGRGTHARDIPSLVGLLPLPPEMPTPFTRHAHGSVPRRVVATAAVTAAALATPPPIAGVSLAQLLPGVVPAAGDAVAAELAAMRSAMAQYARLFPGDGGDNGADRGGGGDNDAGEWAISPPESARDVGPAASTPVAVSGLDAIYRRMAAVEGPALGPAVTPTVKPRATVPRAVVATRDISQPARPALDVRSRPAEVTQPRPAVAPASLAESESDDGDDTPPLMPAVPRRANLRSGQIGGTLLRVRPRVARNVK